MARALEVRGEALDDRSRSLLVVGESWVSQRIFAAFLGGCPMSIMLAFKTVDGRWRSVGCRDESADGT